MKNYSAIIFIAFILSLFPKVGLCQFANIAFKNSHVPKLKYLTSAQSLLASNCSQVVTIQTVNSANIATNVIANLTVNLNATGTLSFFSDSNCTVPITSVVISSGSSTQNFYYIETAVATDTITASATGYVSAIQTSSFSTNPYIWTGGGGNSNWSTGANWSGSAVPGASNVAIFNGTCSTNCSPIISSNININGIRINSSYAGTITQNSGQTITVGSKGWIQSAGTFVGSNADIIINNNFKVITGNFQATSGTLSFLPSGPYEPMIYSMANAVNFVANNGVFYFNPGSAQHSFNPGNAIYNTFRISSIGGAVDLENGNMNVAGNFILDTSAYTNTINAGTISVGGDYTINGIYYGTSVVKLIGNIAGQTITMNGSSMFPNLTLDTGTNPVTLSGTGILQGNLLVSSVGTFTSTGSSLTFLDNCGSSSLTPGNVVFNNIVFDSQCGSFTLNNGTLNVNGSLTFKNPGYNGSLNSGTVVVNGNINTTGPSAWNGSAVIKIAGNGSGQTLTGTTNGHIPNLVIDVGTNPVTLSGQLVVYNYTSTSVGTFTSSGSTIRIKGNIVAGNESLNNVFLGGACNGSVTLTGSLNIGGDLTFNDTCSSAVNGGILYVAGNVDVNGYNGGNASMTFNGSTQQNITQTSGNFPSGNVVINNINGVKLSSNANLQNTSVSTGPIDLAGFTFNLTSLNLNGNVLTKNSGQLVVNGVTATTGALYGGTVNP